MSEINDNKELINLALLIENSGFEFSDIKLKVIIKFILNKPIEQNLMDNFKIIIKGFDVKNE